MRALETIAIEPSDMRATAGTPRLLVGVPPGNDVHRHVGEYNLASMREQAAKAAKAKLQRAKEDGERTWIARCESDLAAIQRDFRFTPSRRGQPEAPYWQMQLGDRLECMLELAMSPARILSVELDLEGHGSVELVEIDPAGAALALVRPDRGDTGVQIIRHSPAEGNRIVMRVVAAMDAQFIGAYLRIARPRVDR